MNREDTAREGRRGSVAGLPISVVRWGVVIFVAASVLGFAVVFLISKDWSTELGSFRRFNPIWFLPAAGLMMLDWLGGGLRFRALMGPQDHVVPLRKCVPIGVAGTAMGYLTPSGTGSGPANIYGLMRQDLSFGRAAAVNAVSFMANAVFLSIAGLTAWGLGISESIANVRLPVANLSAATLFGWTAGFFAMTVGLVVTLALIPGVARRVIRRFLGPDHPRIERVLHHFEELHDGLVVYWRGGKLAFLASVLGAAVHFGSRFLLGWVVLKGFVAGAPFVQVALLHMVIQYLLFLMPTPGGAGVGEIITALVMAPFLPAALIVPYTAVWRIFLTYGTLGVGTGILLTWLGKEGAR